jgi:hypothetical protein
LVSMPVEEQVLVQSADEMSDATFCKHMNVRHPDNLGGLAELWPEPAVIKAWRAFHRRLHALSPRGYDHEHE